MKRIVAGAVGVVVFGALAALTAVHFGLVPANADATPSALETWAAHTSLHATIRREAPRGANPVKLDDKNLLAGIKLYARDCAVCHGAIDGKASNVAMGLYQKPPQLAKDGVEDDPEGYTYWKVYHGIRMTGMPSFGHSLSQTEIWQLALFLKHMDALTPAAKKAWASIPSQAAKS